MILVELREFSNVLLNNSQYDIIVTFFLDGHKRYHSLIEFPTTKRGTAWDARLHVQEMDKLGKWIFCLMA